MLDALLDETDTIYHAQTLSHGGDCLSSGDLWNFATRSPQALRYAINNYRPTPPTEAMQFGTVFHAYILENKKLWVNVPPVARKDGRVDKRLKCYKDWRKTVGDNQIIFTDEQHNTLMEMAEAVAGHTSAQSLLFGSLREKVARGVVDDVLCHAKVDIINPQMGAMADLKTCDDLDKLFRELNRAEYSGYQHKYLWQLAYYALVLERCCGFFGKCYIIAVEKSAPHRCGVFEIRPSIISALQRDMQFKFDSLLRCQHTADWPTGYEGTHII